MYYGQPKYVKKLKEEINNEDERNTMVQKRLSDGARRHLPIIRQANMLSPSNLVQEDYMSSVPMNDRGNDIFIASKKDLARKNLMGYLYARQPTISRSNSFIVGEKPLEAGLPNVKYKNTPKGFERQRTLLLEQRRPPSLNSRKSNCEAADRRKSASSIRPDSNKLSLPEIMRDIYSSAAKLDSPEEIDEDFQSSEGNSLDIAENVIPLAIPKYHKAVKVFPPNHRPITPGLIEKLNKMKLPPKKLTEQWLRQMPEEHKRYQENRSRGRPPESPNRWIYSDNS